MKTRLQTISRFSLGAVLTAIACLPANAQIAIGTSLRNDIEVSPDHRYTGTIVIKNSSGEEQQAKIYQTDYLFRSDGTNEFGEPGTAVRSNAPWVHVSASSVTVPPNGSVPLDYAVEVPLDLKGEPLNGSYWSMVMVEGIPSESAERTIGVADSDIRLGVRQVIRYGIQIATHVRGTGESRLNPMEQTVTVLEDGRAELRLDVENLGTRYVVPKTWVEIYAQDGAAVGRFDGADARIYPGTSVRQRYNLGVLDPGPYTALVIFDSGGEVVDAVEYAILIE
ncbi:MAG TPA: hypothetical protein VJB15_06850 [Rhodothermia bacterium]|nr:hypothetical protein [Rhodothermia bacterium]